MSGWAPILVLAAGAYGFKAVGPLLLGSRPLPPRLGRLLEGLAVPLLAALVAVQTFSAGPHLVLDARAAGLAVAAVAVWRRASFLVVVVLAAATAALVRLLLH